jgi:hypothetical protein
MSKSQLLGLFLLGYVVFGGGLLDGVVGPSAGPRIVMVVHETADDTPAVANQIALLRIGAHEAYLRDKQHTLDVLDDDKVGPDGQPPALLAKCKPYAMPEVLVIAPPDKLLARQPFTTANAAMDLLKKNGG